MDNPKAIVTGGRGDLASAIVPELQRAGYDVLAPGRDELDVSDAASVKSWFARVGPISLLINNAGLTRDVVHSRITEEEWDLVVDTNLKGSFLCAQAALRLFPKQIGGHIINIGSFSGKSPPVGQTNYAAAKAGVIGLTQSLAKEYGKRNIRVNAVLPGFLETKMTAGLSENALDRVRQRHALGRFNTVEDAARFIAFLDTMKQVSGQVFQLDSRV
ncbi:MAG: SDR family NAD(P)-dependent oxidoreductase [Verrucomicrobiales bacterium]|nr:SDR family NAD(P)-dependent oxidoreductase [Verrucomicrobiales bacterium]